MSRTVFLVQVLALVRLAAEHLDACVFLQDIVVVGLRACKQQCYATNQNNYQTLNYLGYVVRMVHAGVTRRQLWRLVAALLRQLLGLLHQLLARQGHMT